MTEQPELTDLQAIQARANEFFAVTQDSFKKREDRIAELEAMLKKAQDAIKSIIDIRSDFALLKDSTTQSAQKIHCEITRVLNNKV